MITWEWSPALINQVYVERILPPSNQIYIETVCQQFIFYLIQNLLAHYEKFKCNVVY